MKFPFILPGDITFKHLESRKKELLQPRTKILGLKIFTRNALPQPWVFLLFFVEFLVFNSQNYTSLETLIGFHIFAGSGRTRSVSCSVERSQHVHLTSRKHCLHKTRNDRPFCRSPRGIQDFKGKKRKRRVFGDI